MPDLPVCAVLDDYQDAARVSADWSALEGRITLRCHSDHLDDIDALAERLADAEIILAMRERTPFTAELFDRLPRLKLLVTTGMRNRSIDIAAANARGVTVCGTGAFGSAAAELAWAAMMAFERQIPQEVNNFRAAGPWQVALGRQLEGRRLGVLGLGKIGTRMVRYGQAFGMQVAGWTRTDLAGKAAKLGIEGLSPEALFETSDIVMIQLVQNAQTEGMVTADMLARMKPDAILVNTARGPIVDEDALVAALEARRIRGAVIDVFGTEPLPDDHPFRRLDNVLATPHIGYVTAENYGVYYGEAVEDIAAWLDGAPLRVLTPN
ncbi:2-hydroxyacid dehydrogenase [Oceanicola sp. 22II-s10i]|uniref:D-2-hydroxyacid dehydrogenase family protein n=1 Tax=Oceanicola sp. 22II-s10i TaxID=1317116 RepID=UPI000B528AC2|nr:D-2-hydroxyacid dehydrogenase family protein [Oceanicola sp. 22II-s10i]OWU84612.1 2-hydroxyacid dehydrogenase [Oceanicola sp. 22II-s10i]